jgi:hypothetical protein
MYNVFDFAADFSLSNYSRGNNLDLHNMTERELIYLYNYTGISSYISSPPCNRSHSQFLPTVLGWKNGLYIFYLGVYLHKRSVLKSKWAYLVTYFDRVLSSECPHLITSGLPPLPTYVNCHMTSSCTSFTCCANVVRLSSQSVQFYLTLDSCEWTIEYGIEKFVVNPTAFDEFKFNMWQDYWMKGIYRLR